MDAKKYKLIGDWWLLPSAYLRAEIRLISLSMQIQKIKNIYNLIMTCVFTPEIRLNGVTIHIL